MFTAFAVLAHSCKRFRFFSLVVCKTHAPHSVLFLLICHQNRFRKMDVSHYTFDRLTPSDVSESAVGAGGAKVNRIRVQPHRRSKESEPIIDYDSNDDLDPFDDFAPSLPEEGLMEDCTNGHRRGM